MGKAKNRTWKRLGALFQDFWEASAKAQITIRTTRGAKRPVPETRGAERFKGHRATIHVQLQVYLPLRCWCPSVSHPRACPCARDTFTPLTCANASAPLPGAPTSPELRVLAWPPRARPHPEQEQICPARSSSPPLQFHSPSLPGAGG